MKNLKKALALTIASVSVFGTIASADFLNPIHFPTTIQGLVNSPNSETAENMAWERVKAGANTTLTYDAEKGAMVIDAQQVAQTSGQLKSNFTTIYTNGWGHNGIIDGAADERHSSFGKIKSVAKFSFDAVNTENGYIHYYDTPFYVKFAGAYNSTYGECAGMYRSGYYTNQGLDWNSATTLRLFGKSANAVLSKNGVNLGDVLTLTMEADCVADTASLVLSKDTTELIRVDVTEDDNIDIVCVKAGMGARVCSGWDTSWYEFSTVREQFVPKDAKVEKSGNTVTGKIKVANNAESNATAVKNPSATVIMALYDANGKMIDCGMSAATELPERNGNAGDTEAARIQAPPTFVEITATAEVSDYAYAKFFVWDGANTMNPFTEAVKVNAN